MDTQQILTILGIIGSTLIIISILVRLWQKYNAPSRYEMTSISGGRKMRKLRK